MIIRTPEANTDQVMQWIWSGARDALRGHPPALAEGSSELTAVVSRPSAANGKRLQGARQALERARAKNFGQVSKAFRWLRRDQSAVNDALIHSLRSVIALNRDLSRDLDAMHKQLTNLETQLAEQRSSPEARETSMDRN